MENSLDGTSISQEMQMEIKKVIESTKASRALNGNGCNGNNSDALFQLTPFSKVAKKMIRNLNQELIDIESANKMMFTSLIVFDLSVMVAYHQDLLLGLSVDSDNAGSFQEAKRNHDAILSLFHDIQASDQTEDSRNKLETKINRVVKSVDKIVLSFKRVLSSRDWKLLQELETNVMQQIESVKAIVSSKDTDNHDVVNKSQVVVNGNSSISRNSSVNHLDRSISRQASQETDDMDWISAENDFSEGNATPNRSYVNLADIENGEDKSSVEMNIFPNSVLAKKGDWKFEANEKVSDMTKEIGTFLSSSMKMKEKMIDFVRSTKNKLEEIEMQMISAIEKRKKMKYIYEKYSIDPDALVREVDMLKNTFNHQPSSPTKQNEKMHLSLSTKSENKMNDINTASDGENNSDDCESKMKKIKTITD